MVITRQFGPPVPEREAATRMLPAWPFVALFAGYGLWWYLGLGAFAMTLFALPMLLLLARGRIAVPHGFVLWMLFLAFMLTSAVGVDSSARLLGFFLRAGNYLAVTVIFLYVYNGHRSRLSDRTIICALLVYWGWMTFGGLLGIVDPHGSIATPVEHLLPGSIRTNDYVQQLVHPHFAEIQQPWGAPKAYARPSAPFPYTNGWGCNFALLVPFVALGLTRTMPRRVRMGVVALLPVSAIAAFATLNRGMILAVAVGAGYAAIRLAARGRARPLFLLLTGVAVLVTTAAASGVFQHIAERTTYSSTNAGRQAIYSEAFERTWQSPLLGYGAPRPSWNLPVSVGTQGHVWNVMFSHGFPALFFFLAWMAWAAWRSRDFSDGTTLTAHTVAVITFVTVFYYGFDGPQLGIAFAAMALALRRRPLRLPEPVEQPIASRRLALVSSR